jgi:hypothetical protein
MVAPVSGSSLKICFAEVVIRSPSTMIGVHGAYAQPLIPSADAPNFLHHAGSVVFCSIGVENDTIALLLSFPRNDGHVDDEAYAGTAAIRHKAVKIMTAKINTYDVLKTVFFILSLPMPRQLIHS